MESVPENTQMCIRDSAETFRGYAPEQGYDFLRNIIAKEDFQENGCDISADEIFISDGAKCDCGNIQELFSLSLIHIYHIDRC